MTRWRTTPPVLWAYAATVCQSPALLPADRLNSTAPHDSLTKSHNHPCDSLDLAGERSLHADSVWDEEPAAGSRRYPDRLGDNHLDDGSDLEALPLGAVAQVPYVVWVSIATVLQLSITCMNWKP